MTHTKRLRITIQNERLLIMSTNRSLYSLCAVCGDEVRMVTIDQAATLAHMSHREIYREVETGILHFIETTELSVLICSKSLSDTNLKQKVVTG